MKRTVVLLFALSFLITSAGFSTITRVKTMGRVNQYILDDANVFLYPSMIVKYSNRFLFDAGEDGTLPLSQQIGVRGFNGIAGGFFYGLDDYNHLGFVVNANDRSSGNGMTVGVGGMYTFPVTLDDFIGIFYGYDAEMVDVGVEIDLSSSKNSATAPDTAKFEDTVSKFGIRGGITYDMTNGDMFNAAFTFLNTSFTDESPGVSDPVAEADGYKTIAASARLFHKANEEVTLVPAFEWVNMTEGVNWDSGTDADTDKELDEHKTNQIFASLGANINPNEKTLVVAAAGIKLESEETTDQGEKQSDDSFKYLPFLKAGIEAEVKSWCDFRAGVEKQLWSSKHEPDTPSTGNPTTETGGSDFQGFIGAGFYVADLVIDAQISTDFLHRGPYFISGSAADLNSRITLLYPF